MSNISDNTEALQDILDAVNDLPGNVSDDSHTHDDRYYTEGETDALLLMKSDKNHDHDGRYYTDDEIDLLLLKKSDVTHSHNETYNTREEITTLLSGKSDVLHKHSEYADKTDIPTVPLNVSEFANDVGYVNATLMNEALSVKSDIAHTHSEYAQKQHTHDYADKKHDHLCIVSFPGPITVSGYLSCSIATSPSFENSIYGDELRIEGNQSAVIASHGGYIANDSYEVCLCASELCEATEDALNAFATGLKTKVNGQNTFAAGYKNTANNNQFVIGKNSREVTGCSDTDEQTDDSSVFIIGYGTEHTPANAMRVTSSGKCIGASAFVGSGADFAEYFEWLDGNPDNEDRRGRIVTLDGDKIRFAVSEDDYILGVVSGSGCFIGNSQSEEWQGKYLKDIFGENLTRQVEVPESIKEKKILVEDEKGERVEQTITEVIPAHTVTQFIVNPDYDREQEYVSREFRKEWSPVGFHGQIVVADDGTCQVNSYCKPSKNGIGTAAESGFRVMARLDDTHIRVLVK